MCNMIKSISLEPIKHKNILVSILNSIVNGFEIDNTNKDTINKLFNYFIGNDEFCKENGISLNKGILLVGGIGTGKTILMKAIKKYSGEILRANSFQSFQASEIIDNVNISGVKYLEEFGHLLNERKIANPITCYIDDICSKNEKIKNFGTEINVIEQLISLRYNIFSRYNKLTHFSTNIFPAEMDKYYDERIIDRLIEMCNVIGLTGNSRRV